MVLGDDSRRHLGANRSVLIDVTTIIGAEEFLRASNDHQNSADPFAEQCYVELVQTLIVMPEVLVPHPVLPRPTATDFGPRPYLLQALLVSGLVKPFVLDDSAWQESHRAERAVLVSLSTRRGRRNVETFIDQALQCDQTRRGRGNSLAGRLKGWAQFQAQNVRTPEGHQARIGTQDGIEDDDYGIWARSMENVFREDLEAVAPPGEGKYLLATLGRGLRYQTRAATAGTIYQSHPMRRDFMTTHGLQQLDAPDDYVLDITRAIRGISESIAAVSPDNAVRVDLMELNLPLLGGRLWRPDETGIDDAQTWISIIVERIANYREKSRPLRAAIGACTTEEDYLRLSRDINEVTRQLLVDLGFRADYVPPLEGHLVNVVDSVIGGIPGVPRVRAVWMLARQIARRSIAGTPEQRFLYREHMKSYGHAGT